jgi:hypothetical protein
MMGVLLNLFCHSPSDSQKVLAVKELNSNFLTPGFGVSYNVGTRLHPLLHQVLCSVESVHMTSIDHNGEAHFMDWINT